MTKSIRRLMSACIAGSIPVVVALTIGTAFAQQGPNPERYEDATDDTMVICHYDNGIGTTLELPVADAHAHLDTHVNDTVGPCPGGSGLAGEGVPTPVAPATGTGIAYSNDSGSSHVQTLMIAVVLLTSATMGAVAFARTS